MTDALWLSDAVLDGDGLDEYNSIVTEGVTLYAARADPSCNIWKVSTFPCDTPAARILMA